MTTGTTPDEQFGKSVLRKRTDALVRELASLKRKPTDKSIHDTRVQSRRLRAALEAFEDLFPPNPWKSVYKEVKKITRRLGGPREAEVTLELLRELGGMDDAAESPGREYLIERYQAKFDKKEKKLRRRLAKVDGPRLQSRIEFLLCGMEPHASWQDTGEPALPPVQETDPERAERILGTLSRPILDFRMPRGYNRAADNRIHRLRIDAKKLRYAMEIFGPTRPNGLRSRIDQCRALQDAGGKYHDWCVLCDQLSADVRRLSKDKNLHLAGGIARLLALALERKRELRTSIRPILIPLQASLRNLNADAPPPRSGRSRPRSGVKKRSSRTAPAGPR